MRVITTLAILYLLTGCAVIETALELMPVPEIKRYQDCNTVNDAEYFECVQYNYQLRKNGVE